MLMLASLALLERSSSMERGRDIVVESKAGLPHAI